MTKRCLHNNFEFSLVRLCLYCAVSQLQYVTSSALIPPLAAAYGRVALRTRTVSEYIVSAREFPDGVQEEELTVATSWQSQVNYIPYIIHKALRQGASTVGGITSQTSHSVPCFLPLSWKWKTIVCLQTKTYQQTTCKSERVWKHTHEIHAIICRMWSVCECDICV